MQFKNAQGFKESRMREITTNQTPITQEIVDKSSSGLNEYTSQSVDKTQEATILSVEPFPNWAVRNAYKGQVELNNLAWNERLSDPHSQMFKGKN